MDNTGMIEGFEYENLLKIGFLNEKEQEHLAEYKKAYDNKPRKQSEICRTYG